MTAPAYETLKLQRDGDLLWVTLNRPDRLNALTWTMFDELARLARELERDDETRVVAITGAGRGFCAGVDLEAAAQFHKMSASEFFRAQEEGAAAIAALCKLGTPVIAAVNGAAAGGGLAIALAADIRIASPEAKFGTAFIRLGLSGCDVGVSWLLPRIVGLGHASELMMTGRVIDAAEAERIGLVNRVVDDLPGATRSLARELARNSPFGLRLTKQALRANVDAQSLDAAILVENRNQALASRTRDCDEAIAAFLEKREPRFTNC